MPKVGLKPYWTTADKRLVKLYQGDVIEVLQRLPARSVHMVVTSPPYWGLRDYRTAEWEGGDAECDHLEITAESIHKSSTLGIAADGTGRRMPATNSAYKGLVRQFSNQCRKCGAKRIDQQIGSEETPDEFVAKMVEVFAKVKRVLRDDGTLWLNLGDSYGGGTSPQTGLSEFVGQPRGTRASERGNEIGRGQASNTKLPSGNLVGMPWRVALALQADGWALRQDIIWSKPSPMPESVRNRCTKAHEYIFLLTKKGSGYYYDAEAIREKSDPKHFARYKSEFNVGLKELSGAGRPGGGSNTAGLKPVLENRNKRSV